MDPDQVVADGDQALLGPADEDQPRAGRRESVRGRPAEARRSAR